MNLVRVSYLLFFHVFFHVFFQVLFQVFFTTQMDLKEMPNLTLPVVIIIIISLYNDQKERIKQDTL